MIYEHYKNKRSYIIVNKCLIQEDNSWVEAIIYREFNGEILFCRNLKDFNNKFKIKN